MRLVVTCEQRFSLGAGTSVWTKLGCDYLFWERYLKTFDSIRIVGRASHDEPIDNAHKTVTGPRVEFWPIPYYMGPEQFLLRRRAIRESVLSALGADDALLCRVGSPLADTLLPSVWKASRPYGLEVVGDPYEAMGPHTIRHPLRPLFRSLAHRSLRRQCAGAVAVAYVTRERLQRRYPCPAHTVGVSDVGSLDFRSNPKVFATSYSSVSCDNTHFVDQPRSYHDRERLQMLFVGTFAQMYKGADILIKAVKVLLPVIAPAVTFVGDGKHRSEMEGLCRRLQISDNVTFLGELPSGQAIRDQLDKATLFVMPSRTEGLPRAMIEAMTRALPCIGTRVGGIPELLDDTDLVDPDDVSGLAAKIHEVASQPERLSRMSARNLRRVQEYRPEILTERRDEFYGFLRRATEGWLSSPSRKPSDA